VLLERPRRGVAGYLHRRRVPGEDAGEAAATDGIIENPDPRRRDGTNPNARRRSTPCMTSKPSRCRATAKSDASFRGF
jgi:hypothetical protein